MNNDNNIIVVFIKKYCYAVVPVFLTIIFCILDYFDIPSLLNRYNVRDLENNITTLIGISGTLIGFLFTAMTIMFSLNKDSKYMQYFKKYGHHIIFCRLNILGIIFLFLNIVMWLANASIKLVLWSFLVGFAETIMAAYYTYKLSLNSFQ